MRTSHRRIAQLIAEEADKITDQELFHSASYRAYLTDIGETIAQRYGRSFTVHIQWDESPESSVAHTDGTTVTINTANVISMSFPTRQLKADSILGFLAHESGHLLYTDFRIMKTHNQALSAGRFYPARVPCRGPEEKEALAEWQDLAQKKDEAAIKVIQTATHDLFNILEDAYIEARICQDYPGKMKTGILLNNVRAMETAPSILKQIDAGLSGYTIIRNLILQYCIQGDINNLGDYTGEYLDVLRDSIPIIDDCQYDEDARVRCKGVNRLVLKLWPYLLPLIEEARKNGAEKTVAGVTEGFLQASEAPAGSTKPVVAPIPAASGGDTSAAPAATSGFVKPDPAAKKKDMDEIQEAVDYERSRLALTKTDSIDEGSDGGVFHNRFYGGSGHEKSASDIERLLSNMAAERTETRLEQELTKELQDAADQIRYGNAHEGVRVTVNRMAAVPDTLRQQYAQVAPPLLLLSKRMQRQLRDVIQVQRRGDKLNGLLMGRRFEARNLVRNDGRYFSKKSLPVDSCDMAVALLVDESGSMSDYDRITSARATSIVLHDFCRSLDIPVMIMGHSTDWVDTGVSLYSYASFDSHDNDRYRLMDITSRCNNRDGAALRFVAEQLIHRPERVKLLILISDGEPNAVGYSGTEAEADLRGIRQEYKRKGITMFAAAIGADKPNIERIYKEGFLDITDLNRLPMMMTKLLARYITR